MSDTLLIRADASTVSGIGHVMRSLALAQGWQRAGGQAVFAQAESTPALEQRLRREGMELVRVDSVPGSDGDAVQTVEQACMHQGSWIVADGYCFGAAWQKQIKEAGFRLVVVDDYGHAGHYYADFVLNQNLGASSALYPSREAHTRLLLGTRYVLLRHEFLKWRDWRRNLNECARRILVTLGGSDPYNLTLKVLQALTRLKECETTVVVGGSNPHWDVLQSNTQQWASSAHLLRGTSNMPELMAEADLSIAAGGTTAWELAFMGLPALLLPLAANQVSNVEQLSASGVARALGGFDTLSPAQIGAAIEDLLKDPETRAEMSRRGRALIDGNGGSRVWLYLKESILLLRRVTDEDCRLLWQWANDPVVRAVSFSAELIPWENHVRWFAARQQDPHCHFWIACDRDGDPVGQVRFQAQSSPAVISVSLDCNQRGRKLGLLLIWLACRKLFRETAIDTVHAYIKPDNNTSVHAFSIAGFKEAGTKEVNGHSALVFQLSKAHAEA